MKVKVYKSFVFAVVCPFCLITICILEIQLLQNKYNTYGYGAKCEIVKMSRLRDALLRIYENNRLLASPSVRLVLIAFGFALEVNQLDQSINSAADEAP